MIRMMFEGLDEPVKIAGPTGVVLERKSLYAKLSGYFHQWEEEAGELKLFTAAYQPLKASELLVISDIWGFDGNTAPILRQVYGDLERQFGENPMLRNELDQKLSDVTALVFRELLAFDLDLEGKEISLIALFKSMGLKIEWEGEGVLDRLFTAARIFKYLPQKKLLVFIGAGQFLEAFELDSLVDFLKLLRIDTLFLETHAEDAPEKRYIIEKDYVLIKPDMV